MPALANKNILLGITGGIAAYKSADLCRRLRDTGSRVRVVMTAGAVRFITPLTMQAVSGQPVHLQLLDAEAESGMGHIELARWADLVLVAPASANFIARLSHGMADDLLTTLCLATGAPLALAPAMNQQMWENPATRDNIARIAARGVRLLGPAAGSQACGEVGPGRMLEPLELVAAAEQVLGPQRLAGLRVVVTAGPTWEALDPVRGITNHSSGKMGYAVAQAAAEAGARVILITGPTALQNPAGIETIAVVSAAQMHTAAIDAAAHADIFIGVAAVADYRPLAAAPQKIKKHDESMTITLAKNPDILADVAALAERPFTVGFAAETEKLEQHAREKLVKKGIDMIAANRVAIEQGGFGSDVNALTIIDREGTEHIRSMPKPQLAKELIEAIARRYERNTDQDSRPARR